jgi:cell division protein FtsB
MLALVGYRARWMVAIMLGAAFLVFFVFPTRSLLAQRSELDETRQELRVLDELNRRLELERQKLQTADEIELLARSLHNMIWPGETPFVVVPRTTQAPVPGETPITVAAAP